MYLCLHLAVCTCSRRLYDSAPIVQDEVWQDTHVDVWQRRANKDIQAVDEHQSGMPGPKIRQGLSIFHGVRITYPSVNHQREEAGAWSVMPYQLERLYLLLLCPYTDDQIMSGAHTLKSVIHEYKNGY